MEILTGTGFADPDVWDDVVASTSGNPELTRRMLEEARQREQKGASMDPELWAELVRMSGGDLQQALLLLQQLGEVRGRTAGEEADEVPGRTVKQDAVRQTPGRLVGEERRRSPTPGRLVGEERRPSPAPGRLVGEDRVPSPPPGRLVGEDRIPSPIPGRLVGQDRPPGPYDPLSSIQSNPRYPGGVFPPTDPEAELTRDLGGYDMHLRAANRLNGVMGRADPVGRLSDEYVSPSAAVGPISAPGHLVGEERIIPTSPASVAPAQTTPTMSSSGDGGEWMGPPMPRPNQPTMDGGLWAALRAAFAGNAGNNERLALESMLASRGGANS